MLFTYYSVSSSGNNLTSSTGDRRGQSFGPIRPCNFRAKTRKPRERKLKKLLKERAARVTAGKVPYVRGRGWPRAGELGEPGKHEQRPGCARPSLLRHSIACLATFLLGRRAETGSGFVRPSTRRGVHGPKRHVDLLPDLAGAPLLPSMTPVRRRRFPYPRDVPPRWRGTQRIRQSKRKASPDHRGTAGREPTHPPRKLKETPRRD